MTERKIASGRARWLAAVSTDSGPIGALSKLPTPLVAILGPALGGAFLIPHPWIGALLWLAVFQNLRFAAFALLGVAISEGIARMFRVRDASPVDGSLKANAVLAAMAAAWLTEPNNVPVPVQLVVVAMAAVAATVTMAAVMRALRDSVLPSLVLGHCLVSLVMFAIFPQWTYRATVAMVWWPVPHDPLGWVVTFFRTLGALMFTPTLGVGIVVAVTILLWSRASFIAGVVGWVAGILTATALGGQGVIYYWMPTAYNFFLAGMALGAVFFLPGRGRLVLAAVGGCGASLIAVALQHLFPATAMGYLPFATVLMTWAGIHAMTLSEDQAIVRRNRTTDVPPEEAWWRFAYWARRSGPEGPFLIVPVGVRCQISQAVDGLLSHVGPWRYALDFQRPELPGQPRRRLSDGAAEWNPPVLAPASGVVERVRNDVVDNPLGMCNYAESWGNYVTIRLDQGGWAMLAHLKHGSISVTPGTRIEVGTVIGSVGNSGRSPVPHLHLQVQNSQEAGAHSLPFRLANFLSASDPDTPFLKWHSSMVPDEGMTVAPALSNSRVRSILSSGAPGSAVWNVEWKGGPLPMPFRKAGPEVAARIAVTLDFAGRHLFRDGADGVLVASADADAWRVLELRGRASPFLTLLTLAVPSIPYAAMPGMTWDEIPPLAPTGVMRWLGLWLMPYLSEPFAQVRARCVSAPNGNDAPLVIETHVETQASGLPTTLTCEFDRLRGPVRLEASFPGGGSLTYSLLSFRPGLPFGDEEE